MLKNYLTTALRALRRQWGFAALNASGLAVAMAACLLIGLYLHAETQVDRFHAHADRVVQVGFELWGRLGNTTPYPLAAALEADVPNVERAVRTLARRHPAARPGEALDAEITLLLTDPAFFEVFSFPAIEGNPDAVLAVPGGIVLTEVLAAQFFGDEPPIGQTLRVGEHELRVGAVVADPPEGSTVRFEAVASLLLLPEGQRSETGWQAYMYQTYALLTPGTTAADLEALLPDVLRLHHSDEPPQAVVVPLPEVYLSELHTAEGFRGQARYLYVFGTAALLMLLIAGINYVNLATAQGLRRAREIGVRKALGADRGQVARQFLAESALLSVGALALALGLAALALPAFNALFGTSLGLRASAGPLAALAAFAVGVGVLAGTYPALVLARFDPVRALRQQRGNGSGRGGGWLRRGLVVVQFAASSVLLIGTAVIASQLEYVQAKDLGFHGEQVVAFDLRSNAAWGAQEAIRQAALAHPGVVSASVAGASPGRFRMMISLPLSSFTGGPPGDSEESITLSPARVDAHFVEALGLRLVAGRAFDPERSGDAEGAVLLNEAVVRRLGWDTNEGAVGRSFNLSPERTAEVIGVVADFHTHSLRSGILPVWFQMGAGEGWSTSPQVVVRLAPDALPDAMQHLESALRPFAGEGPLRYEFLDDRFHAFYASERRLGRIFGAFAGIAVFVACLGLLGLAAHAAQARTKEVGIRKVLGASAGSLVALLSRELVALVAVAFVVAAPLAHWLTERWLEDFAYRVSVGPGVFALTGALALGLAVVTVGALALRAAHADPVRTLRSE